jgi:DNA-binding MarR family transcriptional regulator
MSTRKRPAPSMGYALKVAQQALRTRMQNELRPLGVTMPQYAVLAEIESNPDQSNADLARRAFITPQSMQGVLANLEAAGLVERHADAAHGRRQPARLTSQGMALVGRAHAVAVRVESTMRDAAVPLSTEDVLDLLERIRAAFQDG